MRSLYFSASTLIFQVPSLSLSLSLSLSASLSNYISLYNYVNLFISLSPSFCPYLCISLSLSLSFYFRLHLFFILPHFSLPNSSLSLSPFYLYLPLPSLTNQTLASGGYPMVWLALPHLQPLTKVPVHG